MPNYLTLSTENQFSFQCPVFDAQTKMAQCMALREAVWMGKKIEKRQGCQAAMNCGMCPAATIVSKISYSRNPVSDAYGSKEPKVGKLQADILERIQNVIPIRREMDRFALSDRERELLMTTKGRIETQLKSAPRSASFVEPRRIVSATTEREKTEFVQRSKAPAKPSASETITNAAKTGDMSAAINAVAA